MTGRNLDSKVHSAHTTFCTRVFKLNLYQKSRIKSKFVLHIFFSRRVAIVSRHQSINQSCSTNLLLIRDFWYKFNLKTLVQYVLQNTVHLFVQISSGHRPGGQTPVFPENIRRTLHSQYILFDLLLRTRR